MATTTDTRSQIMDAFADQLAADGYQGISLIGVARTVGIQKPSIYHHFPGGKEELYAAVAQRFISGLNERIAGKLGAAGPLEDTLANLVGIVRDEAQHSISFEQRIWDALEQVSEATKEAVSTQYVTGVLNPVVQLFERAVGDGELAGDPRFLMNAFLQLARATDESGTPTAVAPVVTLFLDGARPR